MNKTTTMTTITALGIATVLALGLLFRGGDASSARASDGKAASTEQLRAAMVVRGKYLVSTAGCHDCHTPMKMGASGPAPDMTRALSGHPEQVALPPAPPPSGPWNVSVAATMTAWSGPWGTTFTANLTPDRETGTGKWTERDFVQTIRTGRHLGSGRPILPPMPIPVYQNLTDEDLKSIYWYLQSIPAVQNRVPQPLPPTVASL
jgi:mono/diheme cytochrome c family protein